MLGDTLRREREKQGLTIKDIENETSIRSLYITAIENGDYDSLPGDVYTKGFIRNYAKALNLDSDSLLRQYNSERDISTPVQPVDMQAKEDYHADVPQRTVTVKSSPRTYNSTGSGNLFSSGDDYRERTEEKGSSHKFLILLAVLAVFLGGVYYAFSDNPSSTSKQTANTKPSVKTEQVKKETTNTPAEKPAAKHYDGVEVIARCDAACWVSVLVDGKKVFEGMAEQGKDLTWKGKDRVELTAGNAGAMELTWNGNKLGKLGNKGQVVERIMTKDSDGAAPAKSADTSKNKTNSATGKK